MDQLRITRRALEDAVRHIGLRVAAHAVLVRKVGVRHVALAVLLRERIRLGKAIVEVQLLHPGDVDVHAVAHAAALVVLVEALVEKVAQVHAARRDAQAQRRVDARHRIGRAVVVGCGPAQERHEIARGEIAQAHHWRAGRAVGKLVVAIVAKGIAQADVGGARGARPAVGTFGEGPVGVGNQIATNQIRPARARRVARGDAQPGFRRSLVGRYRRIALERAATR